MSLIKKLFKTNFADRLCQCEYQNAVKKCPIATRLLTAALHLNTQIKLFINWSDTKSKNKETTLVCLEHFYELFTTEDGNLENVSFGVMDLIQNSRLYIIL